MNNGAETIFTPLSTAITAAVIVIVLIAAHFLREKIKEDNKNAEEPKPEIWLRDIKKLEIEEEEYVEGEKE